MADNSYQFNLFNFDKEHYKITKPIRLIELFAGIGAQAKALEVLGVPFEHYKICEWAEQSIKAYNSIHLKDFTDYSANLNKQELIDYLQGNISTDCSTSCDVSKKNEKWLRDTYNNCVATHNLMNIMKVKGKDLEIVDTDKYEYVMTYSFPCQDLSLAGNRRGMATSQADGGTRSGLLWEVERLLDELENKPQILLMENVPEVIGTKNVEHFIKWSAKLESLGYSNFFQILNAKNYGIPQNRNRCFMISVLGDCAYDFPLKIKLEYRLKDFLEKEVDEKYYLSEKMIRYISQSGTKNFKVDTKINLETARPITTEQNKRAGTTNYVCEDLPDNADLKKCNHILDLNYYNHEESDRIYGVDGLSPTITTGYDNAKGIKIAYPQDYKTINRVIKNVHSQDEQVAPTITASGTDSINHQNCVLVVEKKPNYGRAALNETIENQELENGDFIDAYNRTIKKDIAGSITTRVNEANNTFIAVKSTHNQKEQLTPKQFKRFKNYITWKNKKGQFNTECNRASFGSDLSLTISTTDMAKVVKKNLRIRKLTPTECMRLMGFEDIDTQAMYDAGLSDANIYHCAGDSIAVTCLMGLLGTMLLSEKELNNKIKEYVERIKE